MDGDRFASRSHGRASSSLSTKSNPSSSKQPSLSCTCGTVERVPCIAHIGLGKRRGRYGRFGQPSPSPSLSLHCCFPAAPTTIVSCTCQLCLSGNGSRGARSSPHKHRATALRHRVAAPRAGRRGESPRRCGRCAEERGRPTRPCRSSISMSTAADAAAAAPVSRASVLHPPTPHGRRFSSLPRLHLGRKLDMPWYVKPSLREGARFPPGYTAKPFAGLHARRSAISVAAQGRAVRKGVGEMREAL